MQNVIQWSAIKIAIKKKNYKKLPAAGGFITKHPTVIRLRYTSLLTTSPDLEIFAI